MLELHPILPQHTLDWVRIRALAYYGPTHVCLHSGRVSEFSMRGMAEDWKRNLEKADMWHWRVIDTELEVEDGEENANDEGPKCEENEIRGRTVGIAVWSMHNLPPSDSSAEKETQNAAVRKDEPPPFVPPELRVDAMMSLLGPLRAAQPEIMASPEPYLMLNQLATHPSQQCRGIGSLLLGWGLKKADRENLTCYLTASKVGKNLYEKRGFEVRREIEWDREVWGGEGIDRHWCMVRKAVRKEER